jgi:serine/threonine protein kinase
MRYISMIVLIALLTTCCHDYAQINVNNNFLDNKNKKYSIMPESEFIKQPKEIQREVFMILAQICNYDISKIKKMLNDMNKKTITVDNVNGKLIINGIQINESGKKQNNKINNIQQGSQLRVIKQQQEEERTRNIRKTPLSWNGDDDPKAIKGILNWNCIKDNTNVANTTSSEVKDQETDVADTTSDQETDVANTTSDQETDVANTTSDQETDVANTTSDQETDVANTTSSEVKDQETALVRPNVGGFRRRSSSDSESGSTSSDTTDSEEYKNKNKLGKFANSQISDINEKKDFLDKMHIMEQLLDLIYKHKLNKDNINAKLKSIKSSRIKITIIRYLIRFLDQSREFDRQAKPACLLLTEVLDKLYIDYCNEFFPVQQNHAENFLSKFTGITLRRNFFQIILFLRDPIKSFSDNLQKVLNSETIKNKEIVLYKVYEFLNSIISSADTMTAKFYKEKQVLIGKWIKQYKFLDEINSRELLLQLSKMEFQDNSSKISFDIGGQKDTIELDDEEIVYVCDDYKLVRAYSVTTKRHFLVKLINYRGDKHQLQSLEREVNAMTLNLAKFYKIGYIENKIDVKNNSSTSSSSSSSSTSNKNLDDNLLTFCVIIPEPSSHSNLKDLIEKEKNKDILKQHVLQTAITIKNLLKKGYVYNNIALENIWIDNTGVVLINFQNSMPIRDIDFEPRGVENYRAPEMLNPKGYERKGKADVWALGLILCEMYGIKPPYKGGNIDQAIIDAKNIDPQLADLLTEMLRIDYNQRFDIDQIIQHTFFTKGSQCTKTANPIVKFDENKFKTLEKSQQKNELINFIQSIQYGDDKVFYDAVYHVYHNIPYQESINIFSSIKLTLEQNIKFKNRIELLENLIQLLTIRIMLESEGMREGQSESNSVTVNSKIYTKIMKTNNVLSREEDTVLGKGGYGEVITAQTSDEKKVAIKRIPIYKRTSKKDIEKIFKEVRFMQTARKFHNLVPIIGTGYTVSDLLANYINEENDNGEPIMYVYIIMPLFQEDTLYDKIKQSNKTEALITNLKKLLYQIVKAIRIMHFLNYVHRDVKPRNIFITQDEHAMLGDFGLCDEKRKEIKSDPGTVFYMSPELNTGRKHEQQGKSDIWSIAITLCQIIGLVGDEKKVLETVTLSGFNHKKKISQLKLMKKLDSQKQKLDKILYDLLYNMLRRRPVDRFDADQVLIHQFFRLFRIEESVFLLGQEDFINWMQRISKDIKSHLDFVKKSVVSNSDKHEDLIKDITELCAKDGNISNVKILHERILNLLGRHECKICIGNISRCDVIAYYDDSQKDQRTNIINIVFSEDMIEFLENLKARMSAEEFKIELGGLILNQLQQLNNQKYKSVVIELKQKNLFTFFKEMEWLKKILGHDKCGIIMKIISVVRTLFKIVGNPQTCLEPLFGNFDTELFSQNIHSIICAV